MRKRVTTLVQGPTSVTNENLQGTQIPSDIVGLASGGYVVTWSDRPDTGGSTIRARVYDATGQAVSREILVGAGSDSAVTALADGGFAVAFGRTDDYLSTDQPTSISVQTFSATGTARGGPIPLGSSPGGAPSTSPPISALAITSLSDGRIVAAWSQGVDTFGQILSSDGSGSGLLQLGSGARDLSLSALANGSFALARAQFTGVSGKTPVIQVDAQFYNASGQALSSNITVGSSIQSPLDAIALPDGRIAVGYGGVGFNVVSQDGTISPYRALGTTDPFAYRLLFDGIDLAATPDGNIIARFKSGGNFGIGTTYETKRVTPDGDIIESLNLGGNYEGDIAVLRNGSVALAQTPSLGVYDVTTTVYQATDILMGTAGDDLIRAGAGFNRIDGLAGSDTIYGGRDTDFIAGGVGTDLIYGQGGDDQIIGQSGDDVIYGGAGNDYAAGNLGQDLLFGNMGNDFLVGESGVDVIFGGTGNDFVAGGGDDDFVFGDEGDDLVDGDAGNDVVNGGAGNDVVNGDDGNDTLAGELGNDTLFGGAGNDIAFGNEGADVIYGGLDADALFGGDGNDALYGGDGADLIAGDFGSDTMVGGGGADLYALAADAGSADLILGFNQAEGDRLLLAPGQTYTVGTAADGNALLVLSTGGTVELAGIQAAGVNQSYFTS